MRIAWQELRLLVIIVEKEFGGIMLKVILHTPYALVVMTTAIPHVKIVEGLFITMMRGTLMTAIIHIAEIALKN